MLSPNSLQFIRDLSENNSKIWLTANKRRYQEQLEEPTKLFAKQLNQYLSKITGHHLACKIFRLQKDTRFAKDKLPYSAKVHLCFYMGSTNAPAFYFGLEPDKLVVGAGAWEFGKDEVAFFRPAVEGTRGEELVSILENLAKLGYAQMGEDYKKIDKAHLEHPRKELMYKKGLSVWREWTNDEDIFFLLKNAQTFFQNYQDVLPFYQWLTARP